ncbi:GNAT family N-acetyltransferase [Glaciibacter psychrotolerans]|uniref:Putative GNAT superfamily acetyltransferase n=1 Tax=Glaciibacter psychrotolerans TaxID=670054 RepID=A0A7Z0EEY5_9MICO|nr:GNAT family N-acetyltransferase [Leifsonia psychrotolerans]NYJ19739.1 putative GNAT superfamily acetyltransferase [Leifsonia psychrotolerans]
MLPSIPESSLVTHAAHAAIRAASSAGVRIADEHEMDQLRNITDLLIGVWGTSQHGAPIPADLLRSFSHAGSNVTAAYDASGSVCGAAVGIVTPDASIYSLIAGVRPGLADRGVGFALKQHQRAWALARGIETMVWTFDPLVSRNARFNLTKLGAHSEEYIENFYGVMDDEINANDESDRLVAVWPLSGERALAGSDGRSEPVEMPSFTSAEVREIGPDDRPILVEADGVLWCRVPTDIVSLRSANSAEATAWRTAIRCIFTDAFEAGYRALGVTRTGWYRLNKEG